MRIDGGSLYDGYVIIRWNVGGVCLCIYMEVSNTWVRGLWSGGMDGRRNNFVEGYTHIQERSSSNSGFK